MTQPAPVPPTRRLLARIVAGLVALIVAVAAIAVWSDRRARDSDAKLEAARDSIRALAAGEIAQANATAALKVLSDQRLVEIARQRHRADSIAAASETLHVAIRSAHILLKRDTTTADSLLHAMSEITALRLQTAHLLREQRAGARERALLITDRDQWKANALAWEDSSRARAMRLGTIDDMIAASSCHLVNVGNLHLLKCPSRTTVFFVGAALGAAVGIAADQLAH